LPPPRANHSSAIIQHKLFIFGGWDGSKRLNDLYFLDVGKSFTLDSLKWSEVKVEGESPYPRAGMSLTNLDNKLILFGGSGQSALCYNDL
jgi:N-acetylneuraminic acid mutarotase